MIGDKSKREIEIGAQIAELDKATIRETVGLSANALSVILTTATERKAGLTKELQKLRNERNR